MKTSPLWTNATLISSSEPPLDFQVSLEDMVSDTGCLIDGELSHYSANGTRFEPGDILFGKLRPYLAKYWIADRPGSAGGDIHVYRPEATVEPRYLAYVVGSRNFARFAEAASKGTKMPRVEWTSLREYPIVQFDNIEQVAIADYLDREAGEINAMITKLDNLITSLRLRRTTVSSSIHAMDFTPVRLQWLMTEIDERIGTPSSELPLLSVSIHHGVQLRSESSSRQQASADLSKYKVTRIGDIVLNRMRAFQGGLGQSKVDGLVSPDYAVLRPNAKFKSDWAEYVMRSPQFIELMSQRLRGIGSVDQGNVRTPRINVRDVLALSVPLPSPDEQTHIAAHLDGETAKIDAMLAKVAELKSLLLERRAALITDVITGKKAIA